MRYIVLLAMLLASTGCASKRGTVLMDKPVQSRTVRVPEAYPTKTADTRGHEIGSDAIAAGEPDARRTTVRR